MSLAILNSPWLLPALVGLFVFFILKFKKEFFLPIFAPALIFTLFGGKVVKDLTQISRPFVENPTILGVTANIPTDFAFPSLHAAVATVIAWTIIVLWPKFSPLGFLGAFLVAYSRVALGLHHVTDVAGGFFFATAVFWSFYSLSQTKSASDWGKNINLRRKIVHLFYGLSLALAINYQILTPRYFTLFTFLLTILLLLNHLLPFVPLNNLIIYFERKPLPKFLGAGPLLFTWSSLIATLVFPLPVATVAILSLAVGDSVNAIAGYYLNNGHSLKKRWSAAFASAIATTTVSLPYAPLKFLAPAILTTTILEFSEPKINNKRINDNLFIPLVTGGVILLAEKIFT
ncbi:phosphatase PAP2 family protein [Candidatus Shapirobacteria bacterium]|nr:phosphatase PAP2 family protein [Candidatus Shapirobacteria bacterium]